MSKDKSAEKKDALDRRSFLRTAGVGAAAAAVAGVVVAPTSAEAAENAETRKKQRYKETEHVKRYYDSNRL
ncbi:MAG: twin-arginine translocation signal domain-containing protein [Ferrovibrio sp.]|uniref:twin-arginine translocation signal domain-containing protein n=1 Tax=Ferrovibrio sp. TaxID=1917215 RepID=UPI00260BACCC|nr:twin-arginine translocation signal domain-containing protein [Ferrovibrio sp.]MCW0232550.1 twin-arginine translocation signal domain-containing protein [Ferrovibrio sp.]